MRTIHLREHETSKEVLSSQELDDLLRSNLVKLTPKVGGEYGVRPGSVVGTAVLPHVQLLIEPKLPVRNLMFLLAYGLGIVGWSGKEFQYETMDDLSAALGWLYADEVATALRRGVIRGYVDREAAVEAPVGSIRFDRQLAIHQSLQYPVECTYEDFTADIHLNRLLRAAHSILLRRPAAHGAVRSQLRHQMHAFDDVQDVLSRPGRVPRPQFTRLNEHWRAAVELACMVIEGDALAHGDGKVGAGAFTVDMNRLFERFVTAVARQAAQGAGFGFEAQESRAFTEVVGVRPDLLLTGGGIDLAVGDVKYKETAIADWPHADLYQVFAYCSALGIRRGTLIFGGPRAPEKQRVVRSGLEMEIVGIDLSGEPMQVLRSARKATQRLVHAAEKELTRRATSAAA